MRRQAFTAPPDDQRCRYDITKHFRVDGTARCMRAAVDGNLCRQHSKIVARFECSYCGGNDELPPDHCADCTRPIPAGRTSK